MLLSCAVTHLLPGNKPHSIVYHPPTFSQHREARERHLMLLNEVRSVDNWWLSLADSVFYANFQQLYLNVAEMVNPPIPKPLVDMMPPDQRHAFFIATNPVEHPALKQMVPGLSILEQLMGFKYQKQGEKVWVTSGDNLIDLHADLLLCFGAENTRHLTENYGVQYLWELVRQYTDRQRGEKAIEERRNQALAAEAAEEFEENIDDYMGAVAASGVYVPQVFFKGENDAK